MKQILFYILLLLPGILQAQTPKNSLAPEVWLRADKLGGSTSQWPDISGNLHHAFPDPGLKFSAAEFINFNRAVAFNGTGNRFRIDYDFGSSTQLTVITVYDAKGSAEEQGIWNARINNSQEVTLTTQRATAPQSITRYADNNINFPVINTAVQFWGKSDSTAGASCIILGDAGTGTVPFTGAVSECLVFNRILGGVELQMLQSYLAIKYGTSLLYTDYITSTGRIVWNYRLNPAYSLSIAGLGRDDGFSLHQKQSFYTGEPGLLTIGTGKIVASNELNTYSLKDGDFLVWGDNGELIEPDSAITLDNYTLPRRKWLMNVSNRSAAGIPSQISFDAKTIDEHPKQCWLAIDRSATNNFTLTGTAFIKADSVSSDGKAWFNNVKWDTDNSGTDLFTFTCGKSFTAFKKNGSFPEQADDNVSRTYVYKMYPNPTHGEYSLDIQLATESDVTVKIFSSQGTLLKEEKRTGASGYLFKGELTARGIYFVEVTSGKDSETFKLIVN